MLHTHVDFYRVLGKQWILNEPIISNELYWQDESQMTIKLPRDLPNITQGHSILYPHLHPLSKLTISKTIKGLRAQLLERWMVTFNPGLSQILSNEGFLV